MKSCQYFRAMDAKAIMFANLEMHQPSFLPSDLGAGKQFGSIFRQLMLELTPTCEF